MKISPTLQQTAVERPAGKKTVVQESGFQRVLETALDGKTGARRPAAPPLTAAAPSMAGIKATGDPQTNISLHRLDCFLAALAGYQKGLEDPNCQLRDLTTAFERLESECHRLARWAESAAVDDDLQAIVNEGLVTATLEIHRFRSGQYCS